MFNFWKIEFFCQKLVTKDLGEFLVKLGKFLVKDDFAPDPFPKDDEKFPRNFYQCWCFMELSCSDLSSWMMPSAYLLQNLSASSSYLVCSGRPATSWRQQLCLACCLLSVGYFDQLRCQLPAPWSTPRWVILKFLSLLKLLPPAPFQGRFPACQYLVQLETFTGSLMLSLCKVRGLHCQNFLTVSRDSLCAD